MIEVEKKFILSPRQKEALIAGAKVVGSRQIEDTYFDTPDFLLTRRDWWLRLRQDKPELKIPLTAHQTRVTDQYQEVTDSAAIHANLAKLLKSLGKSVGNADSTAKKVGLDEAPASGKNLTKTISGACAKGTGLIDTLKGYGIAPFVRLVTYRQKYKIQSFNIDIDRVSAPGFEYALAEIELLLPENTAKKEQIAAATIKIIAFAKERGLTLSQKPVRGKVIEYLRRKNQAHYRALVEAGVIAA